MNFHLIERGKNSRSRSFNLEFSIVQTECDSEGDGIELDILIFNTKSAERNISINSQLALQYSRGNQRYCSKQTATIQPEKGPKTRDITVNNLKHRTRYFTVNILQHRPRNIAVKSLQTSNQRYFS